MKSVLVGISGGVDSNLGAFILKKEAYKVIGASIDINGDKSGEIENAKEVCKSLGISHYIIDVKDKFREKVIKYFIDEYSFGNTPSPCIICDEQVKFEELFNLADKLNCDYVATGHYANIEYFEEMSVFALKKGVDNLKDQTYMLYRLSEKQLKRLLFPLAKYTKKEVRELAKKENMLSFEKKDSQGICFAKEGYIDFLKKELKEEIKEGNFYDIKGKIIGKHNGYQFYTIGQRRGLGLNVGEPYFIIDIIAKENKIILGDFKYLMKKELELSDCKFIVDKKELLGKRLLARPRFSSQGNFGELIIEEENVKFVYEKENAQNSRGQHLVLYYKDFVLGGGIIRNIANIKGEKANEA